MEQCLNGYADFSVDHAFEVRHAVRCGADLYFYFIFIGISVTVVFLALRLVFI